MSVLWSIGAVVVAVLAFRGSVWARVALTISTGALAGVLTVLSVGNLAMLVVLLPVAATFLLLLRPDVRSWRT